MAPHEVRRALWPVQEGIADRHSSERREQNNAFGRSHIRATQLQQETRPWKHDFIVNIRWSNSVLLIFPYSHIPNSFLILAPAVLWWVESTWLLINTLLTWELIISLCVLIFRWIWLTLWLHDYWNWCKAGSGNTCRGGAKIISCSWRWVLDQFQSWGCSQTLKAQESNS